MVYSTTPKLGLTITVKPYRKSNGINGCGRKGNTGKKAEITNKDGETTSLEGNSFKDLSKKKFAKNSIFHQIGTSTPLE